jgi:membrane peptidoglycan carboxypeptidase
VHALFGTYPDAVLTGNIVSKTGIVGRLIAVSAVGGLIAAAMALPVVATTGVVLRDQANKAAAPASATFGVLPQRSEIDDNSGHLLAYIYDVNGGKGASYSGIDREPVTFDQISPNMRKAVVAIEDNRYWSEGALDPKGTLRALINDLQHKAVQGGSSITQQYVKNMLILTAPNAQVAQQAYEETLSRKLHELRLAITVAHEQSKQEILTGYLNDAYFGNLAYGIDVAAQTYFGTSPDKLTLPQAAMLAGMVENPSGYDPYLHPTQALTRRNIVLGRMVQTGVLTQADATAAEKTPLGVTHGMPEPGCNQEVAGDSAFFCNYVEQVFLQDTTVAKTAQARAKLLATGGLKIYTTLDPEDQKATAEAVNYTLPNNSHTYNAYHEADTEVMVQPGTGKIEGMAENRPYGPDGTTINYAVDTNYGGHPDRFLVQAVHAGHRAGAEHAVRLHQHRAGQHHRAGFHQLQGAAPPPGIPGAERRELIQRVDHLLALHGDGPVDQRVLRRAGAEGRAVQRGQDGSQPGCHLGQRDPAAGRPEGAE